MALKSVVDMDNQKRFHVNEENYKRIEKWLDKNYPGGSGATLDYELDFVVEAEVYDKLKRVIR